MLKERDWIILRHIEKYGAISLKNVSSLYFNGKYKKYCDKDVIEKILKKK